MIFRRWRLPDWSAFEDRATHEELVELVHATVREADLSFDEAEDGRVLRLEGGATLDLADVTAATVDVPPDGWSDVVRGLLASATNPNRAPTDPERLQPAVRVRLMTVDALERFPKPLPHRTHDDLAEVLVIDSARSLVWAGEADLEPLGMELDDLFALGRRNVGAKERVATSTTDLGGESVTLVEGRHEYVASWALLVGDLVEVPAAGVAVAVPTSRTMLLQPLAGTGDPGAVDALLADTTARFDAGPGSLSPRLYRWHDGRLRRLT